MKEGDFLRTVIDLATLYGYEHYHTYNSFRSDPGFPDLVLINPDRRGVVYIECKMEGKQPTDNQLYWLEMLRLCGQKVYVFWSDAPTELIEEAL